MTFDFGIWAIVPLRPSLFVDVYVCVSERACRVTRRGRWVTCSGSASAAVARRSPHGTDMYRSGSVAAALLPSLNSSARL